MVSPVLTAFSEAASLAEDSDTRSCAEGSGDSGSDVSDSGMCVSEN